MSDEELVTITWYDEEITFTVEYSFHEAVRGARDSFMGKPGMGPQLEPDEPESLEIDIVWGRDGEVECKNLREEIYEIIEAELWKVQKSNKEDDAYDRAEARMDYLNDKYDSMY